MRYKTTEEILSAVNKKLTEADEYKARFGRRETFYADDVSDELSIINSHKHTLSEVELGQMKKFLEKAIEYDFCGYACFEVGVKNHRGHGMWAFKNKRAGNATPKGDCLFHSFTSGANYWDVKINGAWLRNDEKYKSGATLAQLEKEMKKVSTEKFFKYCEAFKNRLLKEEESKNFELLALPLDGLHKKYGAEYTINKTLMGPRGECSASQEAIETAEVLTAQTLLALTCVNNGIPVINFHKVLVGLRDKIIFGEPFNAEKYTRESGGVKIRDFRGLTAKSLRRLVELGFIKPDARPVNDKKWSSIMELLEFMEAHPDKELTVFGHAVSPDSDDYDYRIHIFAIEGGR